MPPDTVKSCLHRLIQSGSISMDDFIAAGERIPGGLSVDDIKTAKFAELSTACESAILDGITLTTEDGVERRFSCRVVDQMNAIAALKLVEQGAPGYLFQDSEDNCFYATANDIASITKGFVEHVTKTRTYRNVLSDYVKSLTDPQEVLSVQWGQELTGEWLVQFNEKIALASASTGGGLSG